MKTTDNIKDTLHNIMLMNSKNNGYVDNLDFYKLRFVKRNEKEDEKDGFKSNSSDAVE